VAYSYLRSIRDEKKELRDISHDSGMPAPIVACKVKDSPCTLVRQTDRAGFILWR
jgi:hypothetical protein